VSARYDDPEYAYRLNLARVSVGLEVDMASAKFPAFNSSHEGFAVLKEEVDELWDEVKKNPKKDPLATSPEDGEARRRAKMRAEAVQVAAMAIRFITDCT
jgi:hypothetical protein